MTGAAADQAWMKNQRMGWLAGGGARCRVPADEDTDPIRRNKPGMVRSPAIPSHGVMFAVLLSGVFWLTIPA